jgi:metal-responsive CopG/Arc/MetJ family transcriptional regulator
MLNRMSAKQTKRGKTKSCERVAFTLPGSLKTELDKYAPILRNGNKSGFIADAIRAYINQIRKLRHVRLLREAYSRSASKSRATNRKWEKLDDEAWGKLK